MGKLKNALLLAGAGTLGLGALNIALQRNAGSTHNSVGGESRYYLSRQGDIFYAVAGEGRPVVMVHGINAAASSYEMRRNFAPLAERFRVYAPDLLGFGLSDRPSLVYTSHTYIRLLGDFLRDVVKEPATVIASSLSGAHAIGAAHRYPERIKRLMLIAPSGIGQQDSPPSPADRAFLTFLRSPIYGTATFNAIASRLSVKTFLKNQVYYDDSLVTDDMLDFYYNSSHQGGAKWAPASFLSRHLNLNVRVPWMRLHCPALLIWGRHAKITPLSLADEFLRLNQDATLQVFENSGLLPHDEQAQEFNELVMTTLSRN